MSWSETFRRAIIATLWILLFSIICIIIIWVGMRIGVSDFLWGYDYSVGKLFIGGIIALIGYIGIIFFSIAVYLKFLSEAVTDNIIKRLNSMPPQQQPPQNRPPMTP